MSLEEQPASERTDDHSAVNIRQLGRLGVEAFGVGSDRIIDALSPLAHVSYLGEEAKKPLQAAARWLEERDDARKTSSKEDEKGNKNNKLN